MSNSLRRNEHKRKLARQHRKENRIHRNAGARTGRMKGVAITKAPLTTMEFIKRKEHNGRKS